ncbi:uncharacterized protein [Apostichopus japonicus]|uniref:uncharacterized protein n=1 Tax=Stichopus japonicus TaxID=307972 RepID=UPI003AB4F59C
MTAPSRFAISKTKTGNPAICTLKVIQTKRVEETKIRKLVVRLDGHFDISEYGSKVIMLIGETGSGKTLMINSLLNYILGVKWEDDYRYKLDPDELEKKKRSHTQSQTEWISAYMLHHHDRFRIPYSITIIDTPGFGDTAGISKDKEITDQMKFFFSGQNDAGIDEIDAVIFVAQSDKPRLTASQRFVFDCMLSLFGKDVKDNIFLFTTFADQNKPLVLAGMKKAAIPYKAYFKFNNSPLYAQKEYVSAREEESSDDEREMYNEMFWKSGAREFKKFFLELDKTSCKSTRLSFEVLKERDALNARIKAIPELIRSKLVTLDCLKIEGEMLQASQEEVNKHSGYTYLVSKEITTKKTISSGEYAMTCRNCKVNCHYPCNQYFKTFCPAFYLFSGCSVCPRQCSRSDHDLETSMYVKSIVTQKQTAADVKARYDKAYKKSMSHQDLVRKISQDAENTRAAIRNHVTAARDIFKRLDGIALKANPTSTAGYLKYLIKAEKARGEPGWQDRVVQLEEMLSEAKLQGDLAKGVKNLKLR